MNFLTTPNPLSPPRFPPEACQSSAGFVPSLVSNWVDYGDAKLVDNTPGTFDLAGLAQNAAQRPIIPVAGMATGVLVRVAFTGVLTTAPTVRVIALDTAGSPESVPNAASTPATSVVVDKTESGKDPAGRSCTFAPQAQYFDLRGNSFFGLLVTSAADAGVTTCVLQYKLI